MTNKDLEARLRQCYHEADDAVRPASVSAVVLLAGKQANRCLRQRRISFARFLFLQIRFLGWKIWAVQGALLLGACVWMSSLFGQGYWKEPQSVEGLLFCLSVLVFMTAPPFLYRSVRFGMQEVEGAAHFSSLRLLMARLIIIGVGDAVMLAGILLVAMVKTTLQPGSAVLSVGLPFLLASSACLYLLGHVSPRQFLAGSTALCGLLMMGFALGERNLFQFLELTLSPGWVGVCALLAAFCAHQLHHLLHHCAYTEMQIA